MISYVITAWFFMSLGTAVREYIDSRDIYMMSRKDARRAALKEFLIWPMTVFNYLRGA